MSIRLNHVTSKMQYHDNTVQNLIKTKMYSKIGVAQSPQYRSSLFGAVFLILLSIATYLQFFNQSSKVSAISVSIEEIFVNLQALEDIADQHSHSRSVTTGQSATVDYIVEKLSQMQAFDVSTQAVSVKVQVDDYAPILTLNPGKRFDSIAFKVRTEFATVKGSGSVKLIDAHLSFVDSCRLESPPYDEAWVSVIDASRKECSPCDRLMNAIQAGARGAIMINTPGNQEGYPHPLQPQPGRCARDEKYQSEMSKIGIVSLSDDAAFTFLSTLAAHPKAKVDFQVISTFRDYVTKNIIASSKAGDPSKVVLFAAHTDSVPNGPGINDDGSGVIGTLELARAFDASILATTTIPQIRFAFWTGEEIGLLGSRFYVANLTLNAPEELKAIKLNIDTDMIASPNFVRGVWSGDDIVDDATRKKTAKISSLIVEWFKARGLPTFKFIFNGRSDFQPFLDSGIPAGGVITGEDEIKSVESERLFGGVSGMVLDPCYHQGNSDCNEDCDRVANLLGSGKKILTENMGVLSYLLELFATTADLNALLTT